MENNQIPSGRTAGGPHLPVDIIPGPSFNGAIIWRVFVLEHIVQYQRFQMVQMLLRQFTFANPPPGPMFIILEQLVGNNTINMPELVIKDLN